MNQDIPLPDLFACVNPAVGEIHDAHEMLRRHTADLEIMLADLRESCAGEYAASLGLAAEDCALAAQDVAKVARQIRELSSAVHRNVAKRLHLEPRI